MFWLLGLLCIGMAAGTFIESFADTATARAWVYAAFWFEAMLVLTTLHMVIVMVRTKMHRNVPKTLLHVAFVLILAGGGLTRYGGIEGTLSLNEGETGSVMEVDGGTVPLGFGVRLDQFQIERYAGSEAVSGYVSRLTLFDSRGKVQETAQISMNNTLLHGGFKFYQASYDAGGSRSVLHVTRDPGSTVSYLGYALLFLGLIWNLFDRRSRFRQLFSALKTTASAGLLCLMMSPNSLIAQDAYEQSTYGQTYLEDLTRAQPGIDSSFGRLYALAENGRIAPMDSLNRAILRKLSRKESYRGLSANAVMLGMLTNHHFWRMQPMLSIKHPQMKTLLGMTQDSTHAAFADFFGRDGYILLKPLREAREKRGFDRSEFDREVLRQDERINILIMAFEGSFYSIFPVQQEGNLHWWDFETLWTHAEESGEDMLRKDAQKALEAAFARDFAEAFTIMETWQIRQQTIYPHYSALSLESEIRTNRYRPFTWLGIVFTLFGFIVLIYGVWAQLSESSRLRKASVPFSWVFGILLLIQAAALGIRWHLGGYAPMSNGYESLLYLSFATGVLGFLFFRSFLPALGSAGIISGVFLLVALLSSYDPQITPLVPVLNSYWLILHVSVITASYGFFGIGAVLGTVGLLHYLIPHPGSVNSILTLQRLNELALTLGLVLLVIGNFLGAMWAGESWGRYWGWDPKETWSLISIFIYSALLHLHLTRSSPWLFQVLSVAAFGSILMTYFGVNYYLAGMHSYASQDSPAVPAWVFAVLIGFLVMVAATYRHRHRCLSDAVLTESD